MGLESTSWVPDTWQTSGMEGEVLGELTGHAGTDAFCEINAVGLPFQS
jgi:hypothetical protein